MVGFCSGVDISADAVTFPSNDYRIKSGDRQKLVRLATPEFIRRFLIHVLPDGFHRRRHHGLLASSQRTASIARIRDMLGETLLKPDPRASAEILPLTLREPCPCCGGPIRVVETVRRGERPSFRAPPREQAA